MNHDIGPVTTFEEDVKLLGIEHLFEDATTAPAPANGTAQRQPEEAEEVEETVEDEIDEQDDEEANDESDDEADEDDDEEDDEDEDEDEAEEDVEVDPDFAAMVESDEKLGAAIDVLGQFYEQLAEDEGAEVGHDEMVGVIEAYEYIAQQTGLLDEMRRFRFKGGKKRRLTRGAVKKMKKERQQGRKGGINRMKYTASGQRVRKTADEIRAEKKAKRFLAAGKASKGGGAMRRMRSLKKSKRLASDVEQDGNPLSELVANLGALKEAVRGDVDFRRKAEELKEGFTSIGETAHTWMEAIAAEVKQAVEEDEGFDAEQDPRVQVGRHLEQIAGHAAQIIEALDSGKVNLEHVESDLESLAADLHDAAEVMKQVD